MILWFWLSLLVQVLMTAQADPQAIRPAQPPAAVAPAQKTATIHGKTTDARTGSPLKDVQVAMQVIGRGEIAGSASSDATGSYEIRVAPGLYSVSASKDGFVTAQYLDVANLPVLQLGDGDETAVDFRMTPGAAIAGTVTDARGMAIPYAIVLATMKMYRQGKVELGLRASALTDKHGGYRLTNLPAGRYYLQVGKRGTAGPGVRTFVPVYYPGASRIEDAQAISIAAGEAKSAVDFQLRDAATYNVSGRITFLDTGQPVANMAIRMDPPGFGINAKTQSRADGTFRLEGLTAGGYRMEGKLIGDSHGSPHGYFLRFFEVTAADITNLIIRVGYGTTLKGTLRAAGGSLPERMSVQAFVRNPLGGTGYVRTAIAAANGAFEIHGVQPGICDLAITSGPASAGRAREFFLGAVTVDDQDVSDSGIRVPEGTAPVEVSVTVDFRPGTITGKTLDFEDRPIPGANVALMSADPKKRLLYPYWKAIKSDREGAFRLGSLVPGDYLLMIWPGYRPWAGLDPEAFAILEKHAVRVRVEQSGVVNRNLRLTKEVRDMLDALSP